MVFSSRETGASGVGVRSVRLEMMDLDDHQVEEFIHGELGDQANAMIALLDDSLRRLSSSPFYLVKLIELYKTTGSLPGNFASVLHRWVTDHENRILWEVRADENDVAIWREAAEHLAYKMIEADGGDAAQYALPRETAIRLLTDLLSEKRWHSPGKRP